MKILQTKKKYSRKTKLKNKNRLTKTKNKLKNKNRLSKTKTKLKNKNKNKLKNNNRLTKTKNKLKTKTKRKSTKKLFKSKKSKKLSLKQQKAGGGIFRFCNVSNIRNCFPNDQLADHNCDPECLIRIQGYINNFSRLDEFSKTFSESEKVDLIVTENKEANRPIYDSIFSDVSDKQTKQEKYSEFKSILDEILARDINRKANFYFNRDNNELTKFYFKNSGTYSQKIDGTLGNKSIFTDTKNRMSVDIGHSLVSNYEIDGDLSNESIVNQFLIISIQAQGLIGQIINYLYSKYNEKYQTEGQSIEQSIEQSISNKLATDNLSVSEYVYFTLITKDNIYIICVLQLEHSVIKRSFGYNIFVVDYNLTSKKLNMYCSKFILGELSLYMTFFEMIEKYTNINNTEFNRRLLIELNISKNMPISPRFIYEVFRNTIGSSFKTVKRGVQQLIQKFDISGLKFQSIQIYRTTDNKLCLVLKKNYVSNKPFYGYLLDKDFSFTLDDSKTHITINKTKTIKAFIEMNDGEKEINCGEYTSILRSISQERNVYQLDDLVQFLKLLGHIPTPTVTIPTPTPPPEPVAEPASASAPAPAPASEPVQVL